MHKIIKKYVKERDEMLLKCSVAELRTFIKNHTEFYEPMFIDAINKAPDEILEISLHKMIVNCTSLPFDFRQKSADWLLDRGFRLDTGGAFDD
jgi:hypothetical protein